MVTAFAATFALALPAAGADGPRRPMRPADLASEREIGGFSVSPSGDAVVYAVSRVDVAADRAQSDLVLASIRDGSLLTLTHTTSASETEPKWSPDGRTIAFLSDRTDGGAPGDVDQVWILDRAGGEARPLTRVAGGVEDFVWAPDGRHLVLVVSEPDPADAERVTPEGAPKPLVIDRYYFQEDGVGWLRHARRHLWSLDRVTLELTQLTDGDRDTLMPAVSPDGTRVAYLAKRGTEPPGGGAPDLDRTWVWTAFVEALPWSAGADADKAPIAVSDVVGGDDEPAYGSRPAWSPDSRTLAVVRADDPARFYYATARVVLAPADGHGTAVVAVADVDRNTWAPVFSRDGKDLWLLFEDDGSDMLARVRLGSLGKGAAARTLVTPAPAAVDAFELGGVGRDAVAVWLASTPTAPGELSVVGRGAPVALTHENTGWLAELSLAELRPVAFPSEGGAEVHGWLALPARAASAGPGPAVLRLHGGPVSQFRPEWRPEWQILVGAGYAVLLPNPRGSSGRGSAWAEAIWADWGGVDTADVLAGADYLVSAGIADPARLGVGGWSYGGILTDQVISHDARFAAAISGAGTGNALAGYGTDMYVREYEAELGLPWVDLEPWLRTSYPLLHADRIHTPTLFLCGEDDLNVPAIDSAQMYQALRSLAVPTELVIYPGETHGISRPSFLRDRIERYLAWYARFLGPER